MVRIMAENIQNDTVLFQMAHSMGESEGENTDAPQLPQEPNKTKLVVEKLKARTANNGTATKGNLPAPETSRSEKLIEPKIVWQYASHTGEDIKFSLEEAEKARELVKSVDISSITKGAAINSGQHDMGSGPWPVFMTQWIRH